MHVHIRPNTRTHKQRQEKETLKDEIRRWIHTHIKNESKRKINFPMCLLAFKIKLCCYKWDKYDDDHDDSSSSWNDLDTIFYTLCLLPVNSVVSLQEWHSWCDCFIKRSQRLVENRHKRHVWQTQLLFRAPH